MGDVMRTETQTVRIGEYMGQVDWTHSTAKDMPAVWREAEADPGSHTLNGRPVLQVGMYDGWPYWEPRPAVLYMGPLGPEWTFFDSYSVHPDSMDKVREPSS